MTFNSEVVKKVNLPSILLLIMIFLFISSCNGRMLRRSPPAFIAREGYNEFKAHKQNNIDQ
ncbi:MAG TPA: hypothetical protein QF753_14470 [Victivallales bacterium]|nr:hypothetical protein [Victivallales bacterium]